MPTSLRKALEKASVDNGCPSGVRSYNSFYAHNEQARRSYGFDSLRVIIRTLRWPAGFERMPDYPANDSQDWQTNLQGIARNDRSWFFCKKDALEIVPLGVDLNGLGTYHFENHEYGPPLGSNSAGAEYSLVFDDADSGIARIKAPFGYDHMGALSVQTLGGDCVLYIPIQDTTQQHRPILYAVKVKNGISVLDENWFCEIPAEGDQGAWCAIDPVTNVLYTGLFYGDEPGSSINVYSIGSADKPYNGTVISGSPMTLSPIGSMQLTDDIDNYASLSRIQGGFITPNRHLYLVVDDGTGILGYDLKTGRLVAVIPVDYKPSSGDTSQELEGLCIFSNPPSPGMSGDLHVLLWENGWGPVGSDFWIKHFSVSDVSDRPFI